MSEDKEAVSSAPPHNRYSRYRSVRHAPAKPMHEEPLPRRQDPEPEQKPEQNGAVERTKSMSRYRRSRIDTKVELSDPAPPMPVMPSRPQAQVSAGQPRTTTRRVTEPISFTQKAHRSQEPERPRHPPQPSSGRPRETENERLRRKVLEFREREAKKAQLEEEKLRAEEEKRMAQLKKQQAEAEAKQARLKEEETARLLAEQKRKDLERLEKTLEAAAPAISKVTSPRDKFSFFSRKKANSKTTPPRTPATSNHSGTITSSTTTTRISEQPPTQIQRKIEKIIDIPRSDGPPVLARETPGPDAPAIEQGGGGIVPQTDAPISASNAGERRVLIRCKQSSINLPITPETTPVDLVFSAANCMTQNIIPSTAILLESYTQLGLERRVRRYEHIRDIMNSWDRDTQNYFTLQNSESPKHDMDLETSSVPKEAPRAVTVNIYHSQKPGKWNKRYITLLSTGQIYMAKKAGVKLGDKDAANLCHLSDFDIYSSTPQQTRKSLKPPKKHCYAIKSQQKTTMFLSTENFVHYFCTDHEAVADQWYEAVQNWRSWYLVNRMGEGEKKPKAKPVQISHTLKLSVDESPYTIGSFTPLINMDRFGELDPEGEDRSYDSDDGQPRQIPFHLRNSFSENPLPSRRESRRHPPPVSYRLPPEAEEEFSSSGLLGRTYSQRQRIQKEKERAENQNQYNPSNPNPFMDGPSLLNNQSMQRTMSMKSTRTKRPDRPDTSAGAVPGMPKPLLDFTPQFKEAPQWEKKGRGHGVRPPTSGVPLVDVATTPEDAMNAINYGQTATLFRREQTYNQPSGGARPKTGGGSIMNRGRVIYD
ncbi:hypothetical protein BGZ60DRAFT_509081 [Tricladium varicosporioides]|nr:hypothetical protein BGZ60DRAFT_509081 [Hymenoscyphus varicosporioides]